MKGNLQYAFEFRPSSDRHGIDHADAAHAFRDSISLWDLDDGLEMHVGPDRSGNLLEVGVLRAGSSIVVIHAMTARGKFLRRT